MDRSDEQDLTESSRTETTVRQFDTEGRLVSETVSVVTQRKKMDDDLLVGQYL